MNAQLNGRSRVAGLVLAGVLGASMGAVVAGVLPVDREISDRGMAAWGERLEEQAEAFRRARADAAYEHRLTGIAMQRMWDAYSDRLNGIADEVGARTMSDRAAQAWTDRLNGLAGEYTADV